MSQPALDPAALEYQLETLGNRGQETDFEKFAHALASAELCPNLLPQTGPTGGGDSKVDAETYPIADDLTLNWFVGEPEKASRERWAFAFSTMEDWATKVRQDVAKVARVGRGYERAYYISSRFIRDRRRAEVEDELAEKHGLDVRILDRTWIVARVYAGRHEAMAAEMLGLSAPALATRRAGPLDQGREEALAEVEREVDRLKGNLSDPYKGRRIAAALLEAAALSRALGHPPQMVEGRFAAARRAARKHGTALQVVEASYEWARTAFWWLENAEAFEEAFADVELSIGDTDDAYLLDLRATLLMCRSVASMTDRAASADNAERRERLAKRFDALGGDDHSPSAAARARLRAATLRLIGAAPERAAELLAELQAVADVGHNLIGFPLSDLVNVVSEFGSCADDIPAFDGVLEHVTQLLAAQRGNVHAAEALVRRGREHLLASRPYRAIATIGKALMRLVSHCGRDTLAQAAFLLGTAYEDVGLLWAARAAYIHAAAVSMQDYYEDGEANENQATCMRCVRQVEVRLGRVGHALAWHASARHFMGLVDGTSQSQDRLSREAHFNAVLAILLLRTPWTELRHIAGMADSLEGLGLPIASAAVLFALGHEQDARTTLADLGFTESVEDTFGRLLRQAGSTEVASRPLWVEGRQRLSTSVVLGCEVRVATLGGPAAHEAGEALIAMLESLLATGMMGTRPIVALVARVTVNVTEVGGDGMDADRLVDSATPAPGELLTLDVRVRQHQFGPHSREQREQSQQQILDVVIDVATHAFSLGGDVDHLAELFRLERAHERTLGLSSTAACLQNAIGNMPVTLDGWSDRSVYRLPLRRQPWTPVAEPIVGFPERSDGVSANDRESEPYQWERLRHTDVRSASLIHREQWRAAGFWGFVYLNGPDNTHPPIICPAFLDPGMGRGIISNLRAQLNGADREYDLKLAIIRGISATAPLHYRIVIGSWPRDPFVAGSPNKVFTTMSLGKDVTPVDHTKLNRFLAGYAIHNRARLLPVTGKPTDGVGGLEMHYDLDIMIEGVEVADAWRIDQRHFAACGIMPGDDPLVPAGHETDAPVLSVLRKRNADTRGASA